MHGRAVGLVPLCGKAGCKSLVEDSGFIGHTACSRKNQRGEGSVLDLSNALLIGTLLQGLLFSVAGGHSSASVGGSMWVEHSDIEKSPLKTSSPEAICCDIEACTILNVWRRTCKYFSPNRLKFGLNAHIVTDLG